VILTSLIAGVIIDGNLLVFHTQPGQKQRRQGYQATVEAPLFHHNNFKNKHRFLKQSTFTTLPNINI
jgi:hypothetical protein